MWNKFWKRDTLLSAHCRVPWIIHNRQCRLIHRYNSIETWWIISSEAESRKSPHQTLRSFAYRLSDNLTLAQTVWLLLQKSQICLHLICTVKRAGMRYKYGCSLEYLKMLLASAEPIPHSKLKPAKFSKIILPCNGWSLSLITVLFFPRKPMAVIDTSGCPLTPPQLKTHLNAVPFLPRRQILLHVSFIHHLCTSCPEWKNKTKQNLLSHSTHPLDYIIRG